MRPPHEAAACDRRRAMLATLAGGVGWSLGQAARAATAEPVWIDQRQVGPFIFRATFPLGDRLMADANLAALQVELRRLLALGPCREPIEVLLMKDRRQHKRVIAGRHPDAPYRRALFYKQDGRSLIYAYRHKELAVDLRHEGTHALLHADLPMVPLWLDEGLAEYFEVRPGDRPRGGPGRLEAVLKDARRGRLRPLKELEVKHDLAELTDDDYRDAWAWTHFLLHGPAAATAQLWAFLTALRRWEPPGLMSRRLEGVLASPESAFIAHFRQWPQILRQASRNGVDRG